MTRVEIWTDGSSTGQVGPGGWAYLLRFRGHEKTASGHMPDTTNQRMEMTAALMGLRAINRPMPVTIYTDSAYLMNAFIQNWFKKWKANGWRSGGGKKPVANRDLWEALIVEVAKHHVQWEKVKGHSKIEDNDLVDGLAVEAKKAGMAAYVPVTLPHEVMTLV